MKKAFGILAIAAALVAPQLASAALTATYVKTIDISSVSNFPSGIVFYNGSVFVNSFNNQDVVKVASPLTGSPVVTQFADVTDLSFASKTWDAGRGLQGINVDPANGDLYVAGDAGGTANGGVLFIINQAGTATTKIFHTAQRLDSVHLFGGANQIVGCYVSSSSIRTYSITTGIPGSLAETSVSGVFSAPLNANLRDLAIVGNKIFYSRNGTGADSTAVVDATATAPLVTALSSTLVQSNVGVNSVAAFGVSAGKVGTTDYVLMVDFGSTTPSVTPKAVKFINPADSSIVYTLTDATNLDQNIRDACIGNIAGTDYLFVSKPGATPPTGDSVVVYSLSDGASVDTWNTYAY